MKNTCICVVLMNLILINDLVHGVLLVRIANRLVTDSSSRGGIVRIRGGFSRALGIRRASSMSL